MSRIKSLLPLVAIVGLALLSSLVFLVAPADVIIPLILVIVVLPAILFVVGVVAWLSIRPIDMLSHRLSHLLGQDDVLPEISSVSIFRRGHLFEILFILMVALFVTRAHLNFDPTVRLMGRETEWLTGYGQVAYQGLRDTGVIPLWNPYYWQGEPLIDNAFSYILNPFSSIPQLLWGATQGAKISVVIQSMLVVVGGWFLGKVLGLSMVGRVTLALLMLGKGNLHTNFDSGFFQLASQQVYFPWVIAGTVAVIRTSTRWAIMLLSLSLTLMFFAGNLWHLLPMGLGVLALVGIHIRESSRWNRPMLWRMLVALVITFGLSAVTLWSITSNFSLTEDHADEIRSGWEVVDANRVYLFPFVSSYKFATEDIWLNRPAISGNRSEDVLTLISWRMGSHFYYSYVAPWWFVLLIIVPFPFWARYRDAIPNHRRLWMVGLGLYVLCTMWGMGGTPLFNFLYEHVPYLGQWRFVGRALATASFWVAVLVALRIDTLMRLLWSSWRFNFSIAKQGIAARVAMGLLVVYGALTMIAVADVNARWQDEPLEPLDQDFAHCMAWLVETEPEHIHWLWVPGYQTLTTMLEHDIRIVNIEADYLLGTSPNTIGSLELDGRIRDTERRKLSFSNARDWFVEQGYTPLESSPPYHEFEHCIYEKPENKLPYAFVFDADRMPMIEPDAENPKLTTDFFNRLNVDAVQRVSREYDTIVLQVQSASTSQQVLAIQELAYPGWEVWIDGIQQEREIFARLNAVRLPTDGLWHEVVFLYRPRFVYWGGIVTILTAVFCIGFLLKFDKLLKK